MRPTIHDNDVSEITVKVGDEVKQVWVYANDADRSDKMRRAWAWCDGYACAAGEPLKQVGVSPFPSSADRYGGK